MLPKLLKIVFSSLSSARVAGQASCIRSCGRTLCGVLVCGVMLAQLSACKPGPPRDVLSASQMQDVLYDYHLARALAREAVDDSVEYYTQYYRDAVFAKHGIDAKTFDRSMEWYARHTEDLSKIYEKLAERMGQKDGTKLGRPTAMQQDRASNDTLLWWTGPEHILLQSQGNNRYMFTVKADTMLRKDDLVRCTFRTSLHHRSGQQQGVAVLVANYEGDSVAVTHQLLYATGNQTISVRIHSARKVRSIQGFVYLVSPWTDRPCLFAISDMLLQRVRVREEKPASEAKQAAAADSLTVQVNDSVRRDSLIRLARLPQQRLRDSLLKAEQQEEQKPHFR